MGAAVRRGGQVVEARDQHPVVPRRPRDRQVGCGAHLGRRVDRRAHVDVLLTRVADLDDPQAAREHRIRVLRVGEDRAPLPPVDRVPVVDGHGAVVAATSCADGAGVLLRAVDPVRRAVVSGDVVQLLGGLVEPRAPRAAAIERDDRTLVEPHEHALAVGRVDPQLLRIVAAGRALEAGERAPAVRGLVRRGGDRVHHVGVLRVDIHAAFVAFATVADARVVGRHRAPGRAAVIGAEESVVPDEKDALCVGAHRNGEPRASLEAWQPGALDFLPRRAAIERLEQDGAGPRAVARLEAELPRAQRAPRVTRVHVVPHRRREHDVRHVVGTGELLGARLVIHEERACPRAAAVGGAEDAALVALGVGVAQGGHEHDVRVARVDEHRRDVERALEPHRLPRGTGVHRLVDPLAQAGHAVGDHVTGAGPDNVRVRGRHFHRADARYLLDPVEHGEPGGAGARCLPHARRGEPGVEHPRLSDRARHGAHSATPKRADVAPLETGEKATVDGRLPGRRHRACEREGGRHEESQAGGPETWVETHSVTR